MESGQDGPELVFPSRPRRRMWLVLAVAAAASAVVAAAQVQPSSDELVAEPLGEVATASTPDAADHPTEVAAHEAVPGPAASTDEPEVLAQPPASPLLATVDDMLLYAPAIHLLVVGFHEASSASLAVEPIGRLVSNENTTRFEEIPDRPDGVDYHILSSRGRIHPPTSAVDIVMEDGVDVLAPVTGVVADIREYHLYGEHLDHRVEIHPIDAPHLRVVLVHLDEVQVAVGDVVTAGVSVVAGTANRFPFSSQIDRETEPDRWPHVHLEVQPIDAPRPGDALDIDEASDD